MELKEKKFWVSKTFWANIIIPVVAFLHPGAAEFIANNPEGAAMFWGAVNVVLRFVTKEKVVLK